MNDEKVRVKINAVERVSYQKEVTMSRENYERMLDAVKQGHMLQADEIWLDPINDAVDGEIDPWDVEIQYQDENGKWQDEEID